MLMFISERMRRVGDLATKLKFVCDDIKKTDEIKFHRDEFLLPDNENINIIEAGEKIIAFVKAATEKEYVDYEDDKNTLLKVRMDVLKKQEIKLEIKEKELKEKEAFVKSKDDKETLVNVRMEVLRENENILENKEKELMEKEAFLKNWEDNLKKKEADFNVQVKKTAERNRNRKRVNSTLIALAVANCSIGTEGIKLVKADPNFTNEDLIALGLSW